MMLYVIVAAFFAAECYGQRYDSIACGVGRPNHLVTNESTPNAISSPYYNLTYPNNSLCEWHLQAQDVGQVIELKFFDFDVEFCTGCSCDAVEVYNGATANVSNLIGTYCGVQGVNPLPDSIRSSGQDMYVRFRSDATGETKGFLARYGYPYSTQGCTLQRPEVITRPYGTIFSTNWPVDYPSGETCSWRLEAPAGQRIRLTFIEFATENGCTYDYVDIHDGTSTASPRFGHWYGTGVLPPTIESTSNVIFVYFTTDVSIVDSGFMLTYEHIF